MCLHYLFLMCFVYKNSLHGVSGAEICKNNVSIVSNQTNINIL